MSPRTEEQNAQIKDERKEHILSAALKVFARRGFAATKIQHISKSGGISHGLVYHYFKSKEEIFFELVSRAIYYAGLSLQMVDEMPLSPLEKVRQTAQMIIGSIAQQLDSACYFMIVIHASVMEDISDELRSSLAGWEKPTKIFEKILAEGQKSGEIRDGDVSDFAAAFFAAISGIAVNKLGFEEYKTPDPETLVYIVKK